MKVQDVVITPASQEGLVQVTLSWEVEGMPRTWNAEMPVERALELIRDARPDAVHFLRRPAQEQEGGGGAVIFERLYAPNGTEPESGQMCVWQVLEAEYCVWETGCGEAFQFYPEAPTPEDNGFRFCPYCGRSIAIMEEEIRIAMAVADEAHPWGK